MKKQYVDPDYGIFTPIRETYFNSKIRPKHEFCDVDSETIIENKIEHIERILCYTHQKDWFIRI